MLTMFLHSSKILTLILIIELSNAVDLNHDLSDTKPIIFKILERNNKIIVEKEDNGVDGLDVGYLNTFLNQNADLVYDVNNILKANKPTSRGDKRKLVKRIVPHGAVASDDLQFYKNVGTLYRPLLKLHKMKKLTSSPDDDGSASPEDTVISFRNPNAIPTLDLIQNQLEHMKSYNSKLQQMRATEQMVQPLKVSETDHTMQHLSEMERLASITHDPLLKRVLRSKLSALRDQTEQVHSSILDLLNVAQMHSDSLRLEKTSQTRNGANDESSSDERQTTQRTVINFAPGVNATLPQGEKPEQMQCALFPHQPLWNFWHYKHEIIDERCPHGRLVGNICSRIPPHK